MDVGLRVVPFKEGVLTKNPTPYRFTIKSFYAISMSLKRLLANIFKFENY